jgi:hypothetical protein
VAAGLALLSSVAYAAWTYTRRQRARMRIPEVPFEIHPRIYENSLAPRAEPGPSVAAAAAVVQALPFQRTAPHEFPEFGSDTARNTDDIALDDYMTMPLEGAGVTYQNRVNYVDVDADANMEGNTLEKFRFIRLKVLETRDPSAGRVSLGGFNVMWGNQLIDLPGIVAWNPHTGVRRAWVPTEGWSDGDQYELILRFPYAVAVTRYQFRTSAESAGQDPCRWRLEGSQNGTFWLRLDDREGGGFVPEERGVWMNYRCSGLTTSLLPPSPRS